MRSATRRYQVDNIPRKGEGACASTLIHRGELIMSEKILLEIPGLHADLVHQGHFLTQGDLHSGERTVEQAIKLLEPQKKTQFTKLAPDGASNMAKVGTNAFTFASQNSSGFDVTTLRVFNDISRINHSCRPNAVMRYYDGENCGRIHAIQNIPATEEVTIDYMGDPQDCLRTGAQRGQ